MSVKSIASASVIIVGILGLVGWRTVTKGQADQDAKKAAQARAKGPLTVQTSVAAPAVLESSMDIVGAFESPYVNKLTAKSAGRVVKIIHREGDSVKAGESLVVLDDAQAQGAFLSAQSALAEARSRLAQAQLTKASADISVSSQYRKDIASLQSTSADTTQVKLSIKDQIAAAQAAVDDANAKVGVAKANAASSQADLVTAQANQVNAQAKSDRQQDLYKQGYASKQDAEDAATAIDVAKANVEASKSKVLAAQAAVTSAQAALNSAKNQLQLAKNKAASDVIAANSRLVQARQSVQASQANQSQIAANQANISALQAQVSAAEGQVRQARAALNDINLKSSVNGAVTDRSVDEGSSVGGGQALMTVQFLDWLFLTAQVPAEAVPKLKQGEQQTFVVDGIEGSFSGVVTVISPAADPTTRQVLVKLKVENKDHIFKPGQFAHIKLALTRRSAEVTVPIDAVQGEGDAANVFTMGDDGKAHKVPVKVGYKSNDRVEILSGLSNGQKVIIVGTRPPKEGQDVKEAGAKKKEQKQ